MRNGNPETGQFHPRFARRLLRSSNDCLLRPEAPFGFLDLLEWRNMERVASAIGKIPPQNLEALFYQVEDFGQGLFSFSDGASSVSGTAFSDFLLGRPFLSYAQAGNSGGNDRLDYFGAYFSDEFHATRRFTLTYGLREEFYSPPTNADGRASILDPSNATRFIVRNDQGQASALIANPLIQSLQGLYGLSFITSQQAGLPPSLIRPDWAGWAPRFGFAYDLTKRHTTSLRGGFGVFNSLGELDYASETRLSAPITEFLFGLDTCRFYGARRMRPDVRARPAQLSTCLHAWQPGANGRLLPTQSPQRLRLRMEFVARP